MHRSSTHWLGLYRTEVHIGWHRIYFLYLKLIFCTQVFCTCMYMHYTCVVPTQARKGHCISWGLGYRRLWAAL